MSLTHLGQEWLRIDRDETTRVEMQALLLDESRAGELSQRLNGRISFGTAGLRARMGAGFTCMNSVTVIQASQGLAEYVLQVDGDAGDKGVVIGRDARHNSDKFARLAAAAFVGKGIKVHWFAETVPTPLVPFAVVEKGAAAGVMVTASHNPAQDNGYKVYWSNGCQIIPPHDHGISASIDLNLEPLVWTLDESDPLFQMIEPATELNYLGRISSMAKLDAPLPPFVYTPMHGVGLPMFSAAISNLHGSHQTAPGQEIQPPLSARFAVVKEQALPDADFSTVKFPNPEERGALALAQKTATELGFTLVVANDPDADRLAVAELVQDARSGPSPSWYQFSGNEVGILLASHVLDTFRTAAAAVGGGGGSSSSSKASIAKLVMLCSTVSSGMLKAMAEAEGFHFVETLTGFKWLGNEAQRLRNEGFDVAYAFEEALGYMFPDVVPDKDGIAAGVVFLAATARWKEEEDMTPWQKLQHLYRTYGFFAEANTYLVSPDASVTAAAFRAIRASASLRHTTSPYPTHVGGKQILRWRDLTVGYDSGTTDGRPFLPVDGNSQMITCELEGDVRFTVRGSGTEPKIKIYVESRAGSHDQARARALETQHLVIQDWFSPQKYGLRPAA